MTTTIASSPSSFKTLALEGICSGAGPDLAAYEDVSRPLSIPVPQHSVFRSQKLHLALRYPVWTPYPRCSWACPVLLLPTRLAFVPVLSSVSELPSPVTHTPTQACCVPPVGLYSQEAEAWASSGISRLNQGMGKDCTALPSSVGEQEEVPRASPEGGGPLCPRFWGCTTCDVGRVKSSRRGGHPDPNVQMHAWGWPFWHTLLQISPSL